MIKYILISLLWTYAAVAGPTRTVVADTLQSSNLQNSYVISYPALNAFSGSSGQITIGADLIVTGSVTVAGDITAANFPVVGTANSLTAYDNLGAQTSLPAWTYQDVSGNLSHIYDTPLVDGTGTNHFLQQSYLSPAADVTGANDTGMYNSVVYDNANSGFSYDGNIIGSSLDVTNNGSGNVNFVGGLLSTANFNNGGATGQFKGVSSENTISAGSSVNNYYGIVSGLNTTGGVVTGSTGISQYANFTDATIGQAFGFSNNLTFSGTNVNSQGVISVNSYLQFNDTSNTANSAYGYSSGIDLNDSAVVNGLSGYNFNANLRDTSNAGYLNLFSANLNQQDAATSSGTNAYNANLQFSNTADGASVNLFAGYVRTSDTAHLDSLSILQTNPEIEGNSTVDNITLLNVGGQIRGSATVQNINGGTINPQMSANSTATNFTGLNVSPQVNGSAVLTNSLTAIQVNPAATSPVTGANGITVDMSNVALTSGSIAGGGQKVAINANGGALSVNYPYEIPTSASFFQQNYMGGQAIVVSGAPVAAFGFGANLAQSVVLGDDWTLDGAGLGYVDVGFVGSLAFDAGKTMARWTGALGGAGNPSGAGTLTDAIMFRAAGILPQGGSLSVTNMYGFQVDPNLFGIVGTNKWGFFEASDVDNAMSRLAIGTSTQKVANSSTALEIGNNKAFLNGQGSTAVKNALTPLAGMQFFDTDLGELQWYDGASWVTAAGGGSSTTPAQEVPAGAVDGVNDTFTLAHTPVSNASLALYVDGVLRDQGVEYSVSGSIITMTVAPVLGQTLKAIYNY